MRGMSRRSFLTTGGTLLAATAVVACGGGDDSGPTGAAGDRTGLTAGHVSIEPYVSSQPQRLAFAVFRQNGDFAAGPPVTVAMRGPSDTAYAAPVAATLHTEGLPKRRGVYVTQPVLHEPGIWRARLAIGGTPVTVPFEVTATPLVVTPGGQAPRAASPTTTDQLGVSPICTESPMCPLHTVSLDRAIGTGRPVAVMFATPARCQTQYCGPVLTELLGVTGPYQDAVDLVHVEIYKDATSDQLVPTVDAWGLPGEPWLFGIDGSGTVVGRLDGAFGTDEVTALLDRLRA